MDNRLVKILWNILCAVSFASIFMLNPYENIITFEQFLNANNEKSLEWILLICIFMFCKNKITYLDDRIQELTCRVSGICIGIIYIIGRNILESDSCFTNIKSKYFFISLFFNYIGYVCIFYMFTYSLFVLFRRIQWVESRENISNKKVYIGYIVMLLISRIIALWVYFPGITTYDTYKQISHGLGYWPIDNQQPALLSLLYGILVRLGDAIFGSMQYGIMMISILEIVVTVLIIVYGLKILLNYGINRKIVSILCIIFSIHPILAIYSVTLWKDIYLAYFILLYCILIFKMLKTKEVNRNILVKIGIVMLIITFLKNTGIYIIILSFPIIALHLKDYWKKIIVTLVSVVVINWIIVNPVYNLFNISTSTNLRETVSIPVQQIARVVKEHEDELSEYDKELILKILPVSNISDLGEKYKSYISDPIRILFQTDVFKENSIEYITLYFKLGFKYPQTYIDSFVAGCYGYLYPELKYWIIASTNYQDMLLSRIASGDMTFDENAENYILSSERLIFYKDVTNNILDLRKFPGISYIFSIGFFVLMYLICIFYCILKKQKDIVISFFPLFVVFLTCIASPVYAEYRYVFPIIITIPFMIILAAKELIIKNDENNIEIKEK